MDAYRASLDKEVVAASIATSEQRRQLATQMQMLERHILTLQGSCIRSGTTAAHLAKAAEFFQPSHYTDMLQERNIQKKCGYPLCTCALPTPALRPTSKDLMDRNKQAKESGKPFSEAVKLENYCSRECLQESCVVYKQLSDILPFSRLFDRQKYTIKIPPHHRDAKPLAGSRTAGRAADGHAGSMALAADRSLLESALREAGVDTAAEQLSKLVVVDKEDPQVSPAAAASTASDQRQHQRWDAASSSVPPSAAAAGAAVLRPPYRRPASAKAAGSGSTSSSSGAVWSPPSAPPLSPSSTLTSAAPYSSSSLSTCLTAHVADGEQLIDLRAMRDAKRGGKGRGGAGKVDSKGLKAWVSPTAASPDASTNAPAPPAAVIADSSCSSTPASALSPTQQPAFQPRPLTSLQRSAEAERQASKAVFSAIEGAAAAGGGGKKQRQTQHKPGPSRGGSVTAPVDEGGDDNTSSGSGGDDDDDGVLAEAGLVGIELNGIYLEPSPATAADAAASAAKQSKANADGGGTRLPEADGRRLPSAEVIHDLSQPPPSAHASLPAAALAPQPAKSILKGKDAGRSNSSAGAATPAVAALDSFRSNATSTVPAPSSSASQPTAVVEARPLKPKRSVRFGTSDGARAEAAVNGATHQQLLPTTSADAVGGDTRSQEAHARDKEARPPAATGGNAGLASEDDAEPDPRMYASTHGGDDATSGYGFGGDDDDDADSDSDDENGFIDDEQAEGTFGSIWFQMDHGEPGGAPAADDDDGDVDTASPGDQGAATSSAAAPRQGGESKRRAGNTSSTAAAAAPPGPASVEVLDPDLDEDDDEDDDDDDARQANEAERHLLAGEKPSGRVVNAAAADGITWVTGNSSTAGHGGRRAQLQPLSSPPSTSHQSSSSHRCGHGASSAASSSSLGTFNPHRQPSTLPFVIPAGVDKAQVIGFGSIEAIGLGYDSPRPGAGGDADDDNYDREGGGAKDAQSTLNGVAPTTAASPVPSSSAVMAGHATATATGAASAHNSGGTNVVVPISASLSKMRSFGLSTFGIVFNHLAGWRTDATEAFFRGRLSVEQALELTRRPSNDGSGSALGIATVDGSGSNSINSMDSSLGSTHISATSALATVVSRRDLILSHVGRAVRWIVETGGAAASSPSATSAPTVADGNIGSSGPVPSSSSSTTIAAYASTPDCSSRLPALVSTWSMREPVPLFSEQEWVQLVVVLLCALRGTAAANSSASATSAAVQPAPASSSSSSFDAPAVVSRFHECTITDPVVSACATLLHAQHSSATAAASKANKQNQKKQASSGNDQQQQQQHEPPVWSVLPLDQIAVLSHNLVFGQDVPMPPKQQPQQTRQQQQQQQKSNKPLSTSALLAASSPANPAASTTDAGSAPASSPPSTARPKSNYTAEHRDLLVQAELALVAAARRLQSGGGRGR